jgi:phospholipase C
MTCLFRTVAAVFLAALWGAPAFAEEFPPLTSVQQFKHIVIIVQENRTPDNLFHGLDQALPGADIANSGLDSFGEDVPLLPIPLANTYDLGHSHENFLRMYDNGRMDGADIVQCEPEPGTSCPAASQYRYVTPSDVRPYFDIAVNYGFANRMFQSNQGPSFPAHQFLLAGTSAPSPDSPDFAAENPKGTKGGSHDAKTGCVAPPQETVALIGPGGQETKHIYPCFEHRTLTDLLDAASVSWRYYTPTEGSIWTAPDAIRHMCVPTGNPPVCRGPDWQGRGGKIVLRPPEILENIKFKALRSVSWVIPSDKYSDHAKYNDGSGPSWVASIVNAVGKSRYWRDTVVLVTWDDWGGWYDHVRPPFDSTYGYYENGFRVPLLVVSPYTRKGYVSNVTHNTGSLLKFVETVFGLPLVPPGTFADSRADDLTDFFDFTQPPRRFVPIAAPKSADFFLHDTRPLAGPDNDGDDD